MNLLRKWFYLRRLKIARNRFIEHAIKFPSDCDGEILKNFSLEEESLKKTGKFIRENKLKEKN